MKFIFEKDGIQNCGSIYKKKDCLKLIRDVKKNRDFKKIFFSKKEYQKSSKTPFGSNPKPGYNLLHKLDCKFIFDNKKFKKEMIKTLGENYRVLDYKLVMGVPDSYLPKWIVKETLNQHTINLGKYIKPKFRDITYFRGIDFHQDIIDYPTRISDFITAYLYLDKVNKNTSPLHLIPGSHKLGIGQYPHKIIINKKKILYTNKNQTIRSKFHILLGNQGSLSYWHPFILHGTQPQKNDLPRISVRLLLEKNRYCQINCALDRVNNRIKGKKRIKITQKEYTKDGKIKIKGNKINLVG
jgi:hypothetical protein